MKTFAYLPLLSIAAAIQITVSSDDDKNGQSLSGYHEGAGTNYLFLVSGEGDDFTYDEDKKSLYVKNSGNTPSQFDVSFQDSILTSGVSTPAKVSIGSDKVVTIDGKSKFYACKNIDDPYDRSADEFAVLSEKKGDHCAQISLLAGSSSNSTDSTPAAAPTGPYANVTSTDITVTDYTTYCPNPTTFTITTCNEKCAPHVVTVEEPKTVTITGECVVPTTPSHKSVDAQSVTPKSTAPASSSKAGVSTYDNIANKQILGLSGLVAAAALIL